MAANASGAKLTIWPVHFTEPSAADNKVKKSKTRKERSLSPFAEAKLGQSAKPKVKAVKKGKAKAKQEIDVVQASTPDVGMDVGNDEVAFWAAVGEDDELAEIEEQALAQIEASQVVKPRLRKI